MEIKRRPLLRTLAFLFYTVLFIIGLLCSKAFAKLMLVLVVLALVAILVVAVYNIFDLDED